MRAVPGNLGCNGIAVSGAKSSTSPETAMQAESPAPQSAILRYAEVATVLSISKESLYRWQRVGLFPKPTKYGPRCVGWPRKVVEEWMANKEAARN